MGSNFTANYSVTSRLYKQIRKMTESTTQNPYLENKKQREEMCRERVKRYRFTLPCKHGNLKRVVPAKVRQIASLENGPKILTKDLVEDTGEENVLAEKPEIIDEASERAFQKHVTEELEESFKLFDLNGDGVISAFELRAGMKSLGKEMSMDEAEEVIEVLDENGSGTINFSEFKCVMLDKLKQGTEEEDIKDAFDVFDENKDGLISAKEIQTLFTKLGDAITFEEATDILSGGDLNKDGYIDFEEFKIFCKNMNDQHLQIIKEREEKEDVISNPKNLDHTSHIIL